MFKDQIQKVIKACGCICHEDPSLMHFMPCCAYTYEQIKDEPQDSQEGDADGNVENRTS